MADAYELLCRQMPELRELLAKLTDEQRVDAVALLTRDFCAYCGVMTHGRTCHCLRDE